MKLRLTKKEKEEIYQKFLRYRAALYIQKVAWEVEYLIKTPSTLLDGRIEVFQKFCGINVSPEDAFVMAQKLIDAILSKRHTDIEDAAKEILKGYKNPDNDFQKVKLPEIKIVRADKEHILDQKKCFHIFFDLAKKQIMDEVYQRIGTGEITSKAYPYAEQIAADTFECIFGNNRYKKRTDIEYALEDAVDNVLEKPGDYPFVQELDKWMILADDQYALSRGIDPSTIPDEAYA